jgi:hypothetical protein
MAPHVRSFATETPAAQSRVQLEMILARYGCSRSGSDMDRQRERLTVWFTVADSKAEGVQEIPVRLEVNLASIRERLAALPASNKISKKKLAEPEHVERVAWRHIVLLVEAGLVAAEAGVKRISEFFLADTVIRDVKGREARMIDFLDAQPEPWRKLIGRGSSHD